MQATTPTPTGADVPPQARPSVNVYVGDGKSQTLQIPQSHDDMMALLGQRRMLSDQLDQATGRRDDLMSKILAAPEPAKPGLQAELNVISDRIVQLESNLNVIGQEIAGSSPSLMSMAMEPSGKSNEDSFNEGMAAGALSAGLPVLAIMIGVVMILRRRWKKKTQRPAPTLPGADSERLQRLEHGMEAIAIEVERISEGQRFVTKLLAESRSAESAAR